MYIENTMYFLKNNNNSNVTIFNARVSLLSEEY